MQKPGTPLRLTIISLCRAGLHVKCRPPHTTHYKHESILLHMVGATLQKQARTITLPLLYDWFSELKKMNLFTP